MKERVNIFWFRRDLRIKDNKAFYHALSSGLKVIPIFIFDKNILDSLDKNDARVSFIYDSLIKINEDLSSSNKSIKTYFDTPKKAWSQILKEFNIEEVFVNEDYEPYALRRDQEISKLLQKKSIKMNSYKDQCIFAKNDILKKDGTPYTIYTPYKNKWLENLSPKDLASFRSEKLIDNISDNFNKYLHDLEELGFKRGEVKIPTRILRKKKIECYDKTRDIPSLEGTSLIGIHLRFGTISTRQAVAIAHQTNATWLSELIWREFFMQILYHFPHVAESSFKEKYNAIKWRNNKEEFKLWCEGRTGFPLVDAGMRELNNTGHMHNRVRMVVASFLVKDLLIDWRWGEKYFASKLLDFDLASNNGNWQWAAGTGCDAAPYFRIFNPMTQLKKFDPDLVYVKKWVPEYGTENYTKEMIDHKEAYHRAIFTYNKAVK
ncbi:deoxyribodipyrimidine photo-lyase [Halobacteriovorax sp. JY17]|uniref:cryptochrome/photolyase family protein n=1 Tax=Halobacteriovorax sp. JY17 TaxID=2014617 RepID=UPI000C605420|nr:deoxyribodipyrimidine photo-lyase [Halobacteriovorax sp. JY17]PIK16611.1 MAG: deoxyribodipyrimidine photolyase [Halobacteriovorax sp. JY17]